MSKNLIEELSNLKIQESTLLRYLDTRDVNKRKKAFDDLKEIRKQINLVKFKIKLEKEMRK